MENLNTINYLDNIYESLDKKNKNIDEIIDNIDKFISEDKNNYINDLLFPENRKNAKIPDLIPLPSSTFQLHNTKFINRIAHGDAVIMFNPFFLYPDTIKMQGDEYYHLPYGKKIKNTSLSELGYAYKINFLTTFLKTDDYFSFSEYKRMPYINAIQPIFFNQKIYPLYSKYRLVSASISVKYVGPMECACGKIGGLIATDKTDFLSGEFNVVGEHWGEYAKVMNFNYDYLDYNNVNNLHNYKEFDVLDGIRMIYYPIDNSFEEYVSLFNYENITSIYDDTKGFHVKGDRNLKNGFNFLIYIIGGPVTGDGNHLFKVDTYCNFECLPNDSFMPYLPVDLNISSMTNEEKREAILIIQGKSVKNIREMGNLISWKDNLEKLKKTDYVKTYDIIKRKINEVPKDINKNEKNEINKIDGS